MVSYNEMLEAIEQLRKANHPRPDAAIMGSEGLAFFGAGMYPPGLYMVTPDGIEPVDIEDLP